MRKLSYMMLDGDMTVYQFSDPDAEGGSSSNADDFIQLTDITAKAEGWWLADGTHDTDHKLTTMLIPVHPGNTYYVTNRPANNVQAICYDDQQEFLTALLQTAVAKLTYQKANGYTQTTTAYLGDDANDHSGMFYFTAPEGCYYMSFNVDADQLWHWTICSKPIYALNTFWKFNRTLAERVMALDTTVTDADLAARIPGEDKIIPFGDVAYQEYGKRKLCVIGPSTCMIDRYNPNKNGFTQYVVGWQEYLMPYYGDVVSFGYSGASWGDGYGNDDSIHKMITDVDLSGFDDFVLMGSLNGLTQTGVGTWDTNTPDTDTYFGALRDTIGYIFAQNSSARVWVWNMGIGAIDDTRKPLVVEIDEELPAMCMALGLNLVNFSTIGFNAYTRDWAQGGEKGWTYDGTHYNQLGSYMLGQAIRHEILGR